MSSYSYPVFGLVHGRGGRAGIGPATSGMLIAERNVDNSVNKQLFTENSLSSGYLSWEYTRQIGGSHVSVATVRAPDALGPTQSDTERKVFFLDSDRGKSSGFADWTIFNNSGSAVGAATGVTDTDSRPAATFDGNTTPTV